MGELPEARVRPSPPFERSGVDYAGPFSIRLTKTRGKKTLKGYNALFVCMSTRAIHLEVVEDCTSESLIAAFHRFTSRRGHCEKLFSDQGTNFVGVDALLRQMLSEVMSSSSQAFHLLAQDGASWFLNTPRAPFFGGLWEAAVKSVKFHLRRVIGEQVLAFLEFCTLLCRIEACLNSTRPLLPLSDDPLDFQFLSPSHFLIPPSWYLNWTSLLSMRLPQKDGNSSRK